MLKILNVVALFLAFPASACTVLFEPATELAIDGGVDSDASVSSDASDSPDAAPQLYLDITSASPKSFITTPDDDILDITGDIDLRYRGALADWKRNSETFLLGKWGNNPVRAYALVVQSDTGHLQFKWSQDGDSTFTSTSTVPLTNIVTNGISNVIDLRATLDVNNGLNEFDVDFYYRLNNWSPLQEDGWTKLGETRTSPVTTGIQPNNAALYIGASPSHDSHISRHYDAVVMNGISGDVVARFAAGDFQLGETEGAVTRGIDGLSWQLMGSAGVIRSD